MPQFDDEILVRAPLEEVWKLVHDPSRYPEWWTGIGSVEPAPDGYTMYPEGWPDYPMPQRLQTSSADGRVTIRFDTPPDIPNPVAMAVTLEPAGGVVSPTGAKYLVGLAN